MLFNSFLSREFIFLSVLVLVVSLMLSFTLSCILFLSFVFIVFIYRTDRLVRPESVELNHLYAPIHGVVTGIRKNRLELRHRLLSPLGVVSPCRCLVSESNNSRCKFVFEGGEFELIFQSHLGLKNRFWIASGDIIEAGTCIGHIQPFTKISFRFGSEFKVMVDENINVFPKASILAGVMHE